RISTALAPAFSRLGAPPTRPTRSSPCQCAVPSTWQRTGAQSRGSPERDNRRLVVRIKQARSGLPALPGSTAEGHGRSRIARDRGRAMRAVSAYLPVCPASRRSLVETLFCIHIENGGGNARSNRVRGDSSCFVHLLQTDGMEFCAGAWRRGLSERRAAVTRGAARCIHGGEG